MPLDTTWQIFKFNLSVLSVNSLGLEIICKNNIRFKKSIIAQCHCCTKINSHAPVVSILYVSTHGQLKP